VPKILIGDPGRLRQVVSNLVDNGIKFTDAGEVLVTVTGMRDEGRGMKEDEAGDPSSLIPHPSSLIPLYFTVQDTGIGIPAEQHGKIFEPFVQGDTSTTRQYGGTGLGLSIASRLVQKMGGQLTVSSEPGQGSRFRFTGIFRLPEQTTPPPTANQSDKLSSGPTETLPASRAFHILVAEDNLINQRLIRDVLEMLGHSVMVVQSGQEVLAETERQSFDVIFMDIYMPAMDGLQTTAAIRQREQTTGRCVPIVALTAHAVIGYKDTCLSAGMTDYVSKPFRIQDIQDVLARVVSASKSC
jgi:CheY-like chemotaxis protein